MTEESSEPNYAAVFNNAREGEDELRFDLAWNEELYIRDCEKYATAWELEMDMRFDVQWNGWMNIYFGEEFYDEQDDLHR
jgi:hypothetical protein